MTPRESVEETPLNLSFRMEVVVFVEILNEISRMKVKQLDIVATSAQLDILEW